MSKYGITFDAFTTSTVVTTAIGLDANAAGEQAEIIECIMTGSGTAAATDIQHRANGTMCTFAGTGTSSAATPEPFNQIQAASVILAGKEYTAEPTAFSAEPSILYGFNQRGGMRWAVPRGEGIFLVGGLEDSGFGWRVLSSAAGAVDGQVHYWEP